ncbi:MAG: DNA repair protein RadC [Patescibacteria group bacterium]
MNRKSKPLYLGHRKRLRKRFLESGLNSFLDYEVVELMLTLKTPVKDTKPAAKKAIELLKGFHGVLDASIEELQQVKGIGLENAWVIKLFGDVAERYFKEKIPKRSTLLSPDDVHSYLKKSLGKYKHERFVVVALDSRSRVIKVIPVTTGTVNASLVHPREVFREAIQCAAANVIVAHNHPSGDPEPSEEDKTVTRQLIEAGKLLGIAVTDHIVVTSSSYYSFKEHGLI